MVEFSFLGLGTKWSVMIDNDTFRDETKTAILSFVENFEKRFSRFLPQSEVNAFRKSGAGSYTLSSDFLFLLISADRLRILTEGRYDPAVAILLESAGYGMKSGSVSLERKKDGVLPQWSISHNMLNIDGPIAFDLGGIGKGYCIDNVAKILENAGYRYFLVEGGGDMVATTKADGSSYRIAVEYPGKSDMAASVVNLSHQGIAMSDIFRRRFGKWHHLIDAQEGTSVENIIGCVAVARNAFLADCMTSGLFFAPDLQYPLLAQELQSSYIVFQKEGMVQISPDWSGEIF